MRTRVFNKSQSNLGPRKSIWKHPLKVLHYLIMPRTHDSLIDTKL